MSRLEKLFNTLHENYASYRIKPERPAPIQPQGTYTQDMLTAFANDSVRAYNKFLLAQVFRAGAAENVRKLLSHKDQTRMTVDDAYATFFTDQSRNGQERKGHGQRHQRRGGIQQHYHGARHRSFQATAMPTTAAICATTKLQLQEQPEPATEG